MQLNAGDKKYQIFIWGFVINCSIACLFYYLSEPNKSHSSVSNESFRSAGYLILAILSLVGAALSLAIPVFLSLVKLYQSLSNKQKEIFQLFGMPLLIIISILILKRLKVF
ncbi:hypothetical protein [Dyadobacter sp. CY312]|uniref:hypothetical protein n=1 Tax=Dyadobacter sp. CY312 TaxID=2907303 RepID=UPI001F3A91E8|nr:hypothetical protein [Dyadobacter sp. CY312]MCE7042101.1 hypothetical protein [Dyadobacter sp. CY312]